MLIPVCVAWFIESVHGLAHVQHIKMLARKMRSDLLLAFLADVVPNKFMSRDWTKLCRTGVICLLSVTQICSFQQVQAVIPSVVLFWEIWGHWTFIREKQKQ